MTRPRSSTGTKVADSITAAAAASSTTPTTPTRSRAQKTPRATKTAAVETNGDEDKPQKRARKPRASVKNKEDKQRHGDNIDNNGLVNKAKAAKTKMAKTAKAAKDTITATRTKNGRAKKSARESAEKAEEDRAGESGEAYTESAGGFMASRVPPFFAFPLSLLGSGQAYPALALAIAISAVASSTLAIIGRLLVSRLAAADAPIQDSPHLSLLVWTAYLGSVGLTSPWTQLTGLGLRALKLLLAWGSLSSLAALDVLSYGPMVYLLTVFYNVPVAAAAVSAGIDVVADLVPLAVWWWLAGDEADIYLTVTVSYDEDGDEVYEMVGDEGGDEVYAVAENDDDNNDHSDNDSDSDEQTYEVDVAAVSGGGGGPLTDLSSFAYASVFCAGVYGFVLVQACRFFLPRVLVVHFLGIATVAPARTPVLSAWLPPSLHQAFVTVFLSVSAVLLSLACGAAARLAVLSPISSGIIGAPWPAAPSSASAAAFYFRRAAATRAVAVALAVGLDVFAQCFLGLEGVDAVGAATYAAVWAGASLLTGLGLACIAV